MKRTGNYMTLASLAAAVLLLMACSTTTEARYYQGGGVDIEIVNPHGSSFPLYPAYKGGARNVHRAYVEAKRNAEYGIRITNNSGRRVGVVIAVDGRNIISGDQSDLRATERMYILNPYESNTYTGWRTGKNRVNRFYFTEAGDSYAGAWGDHSAMGVIAAAVYYEHDYYERRQYNRKKERSYGGRDDGALAPNMAPEFESRSEGLHRKDAKPGTGYGDRDYSPSRRVQFEPEHTAAEKHFLKYEWRSTLCRMDVADCGYAENRFWPDDRGNYTPPPPHRRYKDSWGY